jgi:hypothetical protein
MARNLAAKLSSGVTATGYFFRTSAMLLLWFGSGAWSSSGFLIDRIDGRFLTTSDERILANTFQAGNECDHAERHRSNFTV